YYATKAYVISFSEALANELKDKGVTVTCLCPGATDTGFQGRAGTEQTVLFRKMRPMDAGTVARDGYRGLMAGKILVISGLRNRLLAESICLARFRARFWTKQAESSIRRLRFGWTAEGGCPSATLVSLAWTDCAVLGERVYYLDILQTGAIIPCCIASPRP